ncbi:MAG: PTS sugar transporter subunit IIA [Woeseiaceae bacterium]|nr:PTS sugar transporter subunit IIA [Woeseiaceae bacterium]
MFLEELIKPDSVLCNAHARSKKHCLEILSELLVRSTPDIANEEIFDKLVERERLGCTSLDQGVAFPHCRVDGLDQKVGALIKLTEPVEFDSPDGEAVDLVFGLMVPAEIDESLQADIGRIAERLRDRTLRKDLRDANTSGELYAALLAAAAPDGSPDTAAADTAAAERS